MTAWSQLQQQWAMKNEENKVTGIMLWDLSAAFDMLDKDILCKKLALYGLDQRSVNWFVSFLSDRSQKVRISNVMSSSVKLIIKALA